METNREVMFKGQRLDNREWVKGCYVYTNRGGDQHMIYAEPPAHMSQPFDMHEIDPKTLCEYIGFLDVNKNRIWENDLVTIEGWRGVFWIRFIEGAFCLTFSEGDYAGDIYYVYQDETPVATVIGNIHDSKED